MSLLNVIERVSKIKLEPFMAPIPNPEITTLFTLQGSVPYWMTIDNGRHGWWWVESDDGKIASLTREAHPYECLEYLGQLRGFHVIVLYPVGVNYLVIPFNPSDASQRGWPNSSPRLMYLPRDTVIGPYQVVHVKDASGTLLYHGISMIPNLSTTKLQQLSLAREIRKDYLDTMEGLRRMGELKQAQETMESRIEYDLASSGAILGAIAPDTYGYKVTYTYDGATFTVPLTQQGRIVSAGICLNNTDQEHNLASIVQVMQQARKMKRYDMERSLYL